MTKLAEIMDEFDQRRVFFEPVGGNHGDTLIELGSRFFLSKYQLDYVDRPDLADLLIINGSGSFAVELWSPGLVGLKKLAAYFSALPIIVLPSSFQFLHTDFASAFLERTAPAYLFAREAESYARIANLDYPAPVYTFLHPDMAFELRDSPFLDVLKESVQSKHILLIERFDREATTQSIYEMNFASSVKKAVPAPVKRFLKKGLHHIRRQKSGFTSSALSRLYSEHPEFRGLPVIAEDISSDVGFRFEQFLQLIAQAAVVISNRLHAAILAAMLGKTTIILCGHPYGKLESCYEFSMKDYPNVSLW
ncbi:MAG: hypothetical protein A2Z16_17440 [Chloroflexi bacterium RBG_16_54_18]|nr:MAG: hypothetical protein A2Z16_17440 [Chloroflexi bacterium RBG_16_54_18]